jgi:hypothetical protein
LVADLQFLFVLNINDIHLDYIRYSKAILNRISIIYFESKRNIIFLDLYRHTVTLKFRLDIVKVEIVYETQ